jgi:sodium ion-translocating decarboxylase beta subunit
MQGLLKEFLGIFPGIESFVLMEPQMAIARVLLILTGFFLCYLGYKHILDPLLMIPMGVGISMVNAGILIMPHTGEFGTMFLNALVETPAQHIDAFQIYFLQPIYALTFSNGLIACIVFIGIGSITELDFFIANPKMSLLLAIPAELGSILTFPIALMFGLTAAESAAVSIIGGADGPMVLFASLQLARHLFVPIAIVAYIYLSIIYAGYPFMIKLLIPRRLRGVPMTDFKVTQVSSGEKIAFSIVTRSILCLLFPVASPLFASFFLGVIIRESKITRFIKFTDDVCLSGATLFLGFTLGCLLSADIVVDPMMFKLIILGFIALFLSGLGGIAGGLIAYKVSGGRINPLLGIAGVSCIPTTAKVVHKCAQEVNPQAFIMPYAMGPSIAGVITSAIIAACYITMIPQFMN